uniref:CRAL-TRIO domain-containing protein n=1 Tax=Panagrolaimus sp. ES5 TaxID=591445 RepID=A0AC34FIR8_9BILA
MIRLYLMHPPGILSLMWQVVKHICDEKTQSSIVFIQKVEDLQKCLDPAAIPADLGGTWRDDSGFTESPESCCQKPLPVSPQDYFDRNQWWKSHGLKKAPEPKTVTIKNKSIFEITKELKEGEVLCWEFTTNTDLAFDIVRVISKSDTPESLKENIIAENNRRSEEDEETLAPKLTLTSLKTPEHGSIIAKHSGDFKIRWETSGGGWSLISNKLHYNIEICKQ